MIKPNIASLIIDEESYPIPAWLKYFFDVGWCLKQKSNEKNFRIILSAPSRCLAVPFLIAGYLTHESRIEALAHEGEDHFESLCNLEPMSQVTAIYDGKRYDKAMFCGVHQVGGEKQVKIMLRLRDQLTIYYNRARAEDVVITNKGVVTVPLNQRGKKIKKDNKFLALAFGEENFNKYTMTDQNSCEIFGYQTNYKEELADLDVIIDSPEGQSERGKFQELIRVKGCLDSEQGVRASVVTVTSNDLEDALKESDPGIVVFDGAVGFLKWKNFKSRSSLILVLDRTERLFDAAVNTVNEDFIINRKGEDGITLPSAPMGIETVVYCE